jgi:ATP-dependent RNA helicase DDX46/PRP5
VQETGVAVTTKGQFFGPGKVPGPGERKLYLLIEGPSHVEVKRAKAEIKRMLEEAAANSQPETPQIIGRYKVL